MIDKCMSLFRKYREIILYIFFGGLTTVVNYVVYVACAALLEGHGATIASTVIAWIISVLFAYVTNRRWVFDSKVCGFSGLCRECAAFVGARVASGVLDVAIMYVAVDLLHFNDKIIKLASNVLVIIINYILSKFFVFKAKPAD